MEKKTEEWVVGPIEKLVTVPEPAQVHKPKQSHMRVVWTLWGISYLLLALWLIELMVPHGHWIHALLAAAIVMAGICTLYGFKYCEYWERPSIQRIRKKLGRSSATPLAPEEKFPRVVPKP